MSETINVVGRVLSEGQPVPYAHVYLENTSMGTVTNSEGEFNLRVSVGYDSRITNITISSIGFKSRHLLLQDLIDKKNIINLDQDVIQLQEIIFKGEKDSSLIVLNRAISKIKSNFPHKRHLLEAFYRELSIKDTAYTRLIEAAILIDDPSYKGNTVNSDDLSLDKNKIKVIEMRKSEDNRDYDVLGWAFAKIFGEKNDIYEIFNDNLVRFIGKNNDHFLSKKFLNEYDIQIDGVTQHEGNPVFVLSLNSKDKDIFFLRNIVIYINQDDYAIIKIENNLIVHPTRKEILKFAIDHKYFYQSVVTYRKIQNVYIPYYIRTRKYASNTNPLDNNSLQYTDIEFLITRFFYDDYERIKSKYIMRKDQDINKSEITYNEKFWKDYNTVILNPISGKTKNDLEKERSLDSQFKKN